MAELGDAQRLGRCGETRGGSNPPEGIKKPRFQRGFLNSKFLILSLSGLDGNFLFLYFSHTRNFNRQNAFS